MAFFPMYVDITDKHVLIVGGGHTALQKIKAVLEFGAIIHVIAQDVSKEVEDISGNHPDQIKIVRRAFVEDDILANPDYYCMVVAATNDRQLNSHISDICNRHRIPVNVVDDPELCSFIFSSIYKNKDLVCAISSSGESPVLTQYVKDVLKKQLPDNIGEINEYMGRVRRRLKDEIPDMSERKKVLKEILEKEIREGGRNNE